MIEIVHQITLGLVFISLGLLCVLMIVFFWAVIFSFIKMVLKNEF